MTSTPTTRNRLEKQGSGDNANTWGSVLNTNALDLIDAALDGRTTFTLSGTKTLSSTNYAADESRKRFLDITSGTGGTVTIPSVEKVYFVRNNTSGAVIFTTGSGTTASVPAGAVMSIACDATNVYLESITDFGSVLPKSSGTPTATTHLTTKTYVDSKVASVVAGKVAWTEIETIATTSGTTVTFDAIPNTYSDLLCVFEGVSASTSSGNILLSLSSDDVTYSSTVTLVSWSAAADTIYGAFHIPGYGKNAGALLAIFGNLTSAPSIGSAATLSRPWRVDGISGIKLAVSGGAFDAGSMTLYGR